MLVTTCVSSTCTLLLGVSVFFQTENHKKRSEEDAKFYHDQELNNRIQDLKIKANPVVYLEGIKRFDFETITCIAPLKEARNILITEESNEKEKTFSCFLSIDLSFLNPAQRMIDYITIEKANLSCDYGTILDNDYERILNIDTKNLSKEKAGIKIGANGQCISLMNFFSEKLDSKIGEIPQMLQNPKNTWYLNVSYTLSNSCNVYIKYQSYISFSIEKVITCELTNKCYTKVKDIVTWARSEVCVENHQE